MSPYTVQPTDYRLYVDATAGPVTVQLQASTVLVERIYQIKKVDATANVVTILPAGGETIDGNPSVTLTIDRQSVSIASDLTLPGFRAFAFVNNNGGAGFTQWGRVAIVDDINGNDGTGTVNGPPFKTVQAAIGAVADGDLIWVLPGAYNLPAAGITIPQGVTIHGISRDRVTLQVLNAVANTVLVKMSNRCALRNVSLKMTSNDHVDLTAIEFGGTSADMSRVSQFRIDIDNRNAAAGTSDIYGIRSFGTGQPPLDENVLINGEIFIASTRMGDKRGVISDTSANTLNAHDLVVSVTRPTGPVQGSYIGVEVSGNGTVNLRGCVIQGETADVSRTVGDLMLQNTYLVNNNANGLGFTALLAPAQVLMADQNAIQTNVTRYMRPGTAAASVSETRIRAPRMLVRRMSVRAQTGPGANRTDTWTLRKNGADTALTVGLTGNATSGSNEAMSVPYNGTGDDYSIKVTAANNSNTSDYVVALEVY